ncbi:hypothetical protein HETIRDRAFT_457847 [Heterobasidion irregulare TC 32-1]|uniref:Uncharacterized protein n=1 Tax=Heterobasidion irregulare (strain TC 32-1) TaxID=747525 RepID=W4KFC2_HETIT|nr:uncharacterized protein HETIRDRAFT_457847 [Heterobasidion irregulare TC 32-1]ETW83751.1 hypothetical protein HETIRDRAFT_457847 [Heterobasidion irregulare TC 32-1]
MPSVCFVLTMLSNHKLHALDLGVPTNLEDSLHTKPAREPHDANRSMQAIADLTSKDGETRRQAQATTVSKSRERSKKRHYLDPNPIRERGVGRGK